MKNVTILSLAIGLCLGAASPAFANRGLWQKVEGKTVPGVSPKENLPSNYSVVDLDQTGIKVLLNKAGESFETGVDLSVPTPEGTFKTFRVWNTPVMEKELQAQFSEVQTYTGSFLEDANQTLKVTTGPMGVFIRSFSYDVSDVFAIEPYGYEANGHYTLSAGKDFYRSPLTSSCNPGSVSSTLTGSDPITINPTREQTAQRTMGQSRRTYRLALACTGEYALAVSGTPNPTTSQILQIMIATVNNANGVWEREVSISTQIVNNNTAVIYLNPSTDPYLYDSVHSSVIGENQANHDIFIGNNNYDIGHVFTRWGGGLAALASVCASGSKASGVSGSSGPNDIGTFCHEVGHQLGANHTFTSEMEGCEGNGDDQMNATVEPGSGNTIMSYNGLCGADNTPNLIPDAKDDYYSFASLAEMQRVITTSGATCGTSVLGQTPVMMPNMDRRYIIPATTAFELIADEATNTVATNAAPTYTWEQNDIGPIDMVEANGSNVVEGPIFMSIPGTTSRSREFPRYKQLADGLYSDVGERLPNVPRNMRYKVTVRSIAQDGWGTHNTIDSNINIKVVPSGIGNFRVTGPADASLIWQPNQQYPVEWTIGNTLEPNDSIMAGFVNIYLSLDEGLTFPIILATNVPNTGSFNVTAPNYFAEKARVKVKAVGNIFFDVSKTNFAVNGTLGVKGMDVANHLSVFPNPVSNILNIKNDAFDGEAMELNILSLLGQEVWQGKMNAATSIDVSNFAKGAYYIYFKGERSAKYGVKKVVIQ